MTYPRVACLGGMITSVDSCALLNCWRREASEESNCGRIGWRVRQARWSERLVQLAALKRTGMLCIYEAHKIRLRHERRRVGTRLPRELGTCAGSAESADITEASIAISAAAHRNNRCIPLSSRNIVILAKFFWKTSPPTSSPSSSPSPPTMSRPSPAPGLTPQFCFNQIALRGEPALLLQNLH